MADENIQHQHSGDGGAEEFDPKELQLTELTKRGATMEEIARLREAVIASVRQQIYYLKQNPVVREAARGGQVAVIGAYYEISSGAVDFLETEADLRLDSTGGEVPSRE